MSGFSTDVADWSADGGEVLAEQSALERDLLFLLVHQPTCTWSDLERLLSQSYPDASDVDADDLYDAVTALIEADLVGETAVEEDTVSFAVTEEGLDRAIAHIGWEIERMTA